MDQAPALIPPSMRQVDLLTTPHDSFDVRRMAEDVEHRSSEIPHVSEFKKEQSVLGKIVEDPWGATGDHGLAP